MGDGKRGLRKRGTEWMMGEEDNTSSHSYAEPGFNYKYVRDRRAEGTTRRKEEDLQEGGKEVTGWE